MAGIPIRSATDITVARAILRKRLGNQAWTPVFKAQVAAALTTIGEIAITEKAPGALEIVLTTHGVSRGVELRGTMTYSQQLSDAMNVLKEKLAAITEEIELIQQGNLFRVMVRVWQKSQ